MSYRAVDRFGIHDLPRPALVAAGNGGTRQHPVELVRSGAQMRDLASEWVQRVDWAAQHGLSYGGKRDMYVSLGYDTTLTPAKYRARYKRGGIAARIVEAFPKATWRGGAEVNEEEDPEIVTDFEEAWDALSERLRIWPTLQRADILAGLGHYAVVVIGAKGPLDQELPKLAGPDDVLYLSPYGEDQATVDTVEENTEEPRFGQPLFYKLKRVGTTRRIERRVHWTRVIHIADGVLDDPVNGTPRLERVWNNLDDLDKLSGGGSEAFWIRVHRGMLMGVDPDLKVTQTEIDKLKDETDEFIHGMKRFLTLRGVKLEELGGDVSNFDSQVRAIISLISGATGIPQRILLGSERGELASTQDKGNWDERVRDRRDEYAELVARQLVDRFVEYGALPEPEQYLIRWPEVDDMTDTDRANVADKWSKLNGQAGGRVVDPEEIRDRILKLPKLEAKAEGEVPPGQGEEGEGEVRVEGEVRAT